MLIALLCFYVLFLVFLCDFGDTANLCDVGFIFIFFLNMWCGFLSKWIYNFNYLLVLFYILLKLVTTHDVYSWLLYFGVCFL